jgi:RNA polymerase sigma factor (TIGR02999 family)
MGQFTQALADLQAGDKNSAAVNALFQVTYDDLKRLAHERLQRNVRLTALDTTSLVHESYLRFLKATRIDLEDRAHFMAYAARVMRSVVVDMVRQRLADRRGGNAALVTLGTEIRDMVGRDEDLLQLDDALAALGRADAQLVQIVEMRYFAGLSVDQVAEHLGLSPRTVFRLWEKARLVLFDALGKSGCSPRSWRSGR